MDKLQENLQHYLKKNCENKEIDDLSLCFSSNPNTKEIFLNSKNTALFSFKYSAEELIVFMDVLLNFLMKDMKVIHGIIKINILKDNLSEKFKNINRTKANITANKITTANKVTEIINNKIQDEFYFIRIQNIEPNTNIDFLLYVDSIIKFSKNIDKINLQNLCEDIFDILKEQNTNEPILMGLFYAPLLDSFNLIISNQYGFFLYNAPLFNLDEKEKNNIIKFLKNNLERSLNQFIKTINFHKNIQLSIKDKQLHFILNFKNIECNNAFCINFNDMNYRNLSDSKNLDLFKYKINLYINLFTLLKNNAKIIIRNNNLFTLNYDESLTLTVVINNFNVTLKIKDLSEIFQEYKLNPTVFFFILFKEIFALLHLIDTTNYKPNPMKNLVIFINKKYIKLGVSEDYAINEGIHTIKLKSIKNLSLDMFRASSFLLNKIIDIDYYTKKINTKFNSSTNSIMKLLIKNENIIFNFKYQNEFIPLGQMNKNNFLAVCENKLPIEKYKNMNLKFILIFFIATGLMRKNEMIKLYKHKHNNNNNNNNNVYMKISMDMSLENFMDTFTIEFIQKNKIIYKFSMDFNKLEEEYVVSNLINYSIKTVDNIYKKIFNNVNIF